MKGEHNNTLHSNITEKRCFNVDIIKNQTEEAVYKHEKEAVYKHEKEEKFDYWLTEMNSEIRAGMHGCIKINPHS